MRDSRHAQQFAGGWPVARRTVVPCDQPKGRSASASLPDVDHGRAAPGRSVFPTMESLLHAPAPGPLPAPLTARILWRWSARAGVPSTRTGRTIEREGFSAEGVTLMSNFPLSSTQLLL